MIFYGLWFICSGYWVYRFTESRKDCVIMYTEDWVELGIMITPFSIIIVGIAFIGTVVKYCNRLKYWWKFK